MAPAPLHVVFTPSGAGSLRQALADAGRDDQVISSFDNLSFGPIDPPDLLLRSKWVESELGWTGWNDIAPKTEAFWREALSSSHRKVAWLSRRSAMEYAGFLEWLWRLGDAPCEVVDLSEVTISHRLEHAPATGFGHESWYSQSGHNAPRQAMGFGRTVAAGRAGAISRSLAAASRRKRSAACYRSRQACVVSHFLFRFAVDVLCDE
jgi:hypothetical protein